MIQNYTLEGMSCQNCVASVTQKVSSMLDVENVVVNLGEKSLQIESKNIINSSQIESILPDKYRVTSRRVSNFSNFSKESVSEKSNWLQLKPLFIILGYILFGSILVNYKFGNVKSFMTTYMGLFFIVFSFFKILDIQGFANSFSMYDPLAKSIPSYGIVYPFMEIGLGIMFLINWEIKIALVLTIIILGITTFGVTKTLLSKQEIKCACLGTTLNLPMTEATFIENAIMIAMSLFMISSY